MLLDDGLLHNAQNPTHLRLWIKEIVAGPYPVEQPSAPLQQRRPVDFALLGRPAQEIENAGDKGSIATRATLTPGDALRLAAALIYAAHGQLSQQGML